MNLLKTTTRKATHKDISNIYEIEQETYGKFGWSKNIFKTELSNQFSRYYVFEKANEEKKIIGYIGCWLIGEEGHITTLVVLQKYRRNHIADILLYNLINSLQKEGINWLTLEVKVSNTAAINLYKKFGFKELGIRKNYYQDNNEDALLLWSENINSELFKEKLKKISSDKSQYDF